MPTFEQVQQLNEWLASINPKTHITSIFHVHDDSDFFSVSFGLYHREDVHKGTRRYEAVKRLLKYACEREERQHHRITIYRFGG